MPAKLYSASNFDQLGRSLRHNCIRCKVFPVEGQHSLYVSLGKAFHLGQFILRAGAIVSVQPFQCNIRAIDEDYVDDRAMIIVFGNAPLVVSVSLVDRKQTMRFRS